MNNEKNKITRSKIKELVDNLTLKAKEKNMIKPVEEAFKDIPTSKEIHKGKKEYFCE